MRKHIDSLRRPEEHEHNIEFHPISVAISLQPSYLSSPLVPTMAPHSNRTVFQYYKAWTYKKHRHNAVIHKNTFNICDMCYARTVPTVSQMANKQDTVCHTQPQQILQDTMYLQGGSPFNYNIQNVSPLAQCLLPSDITRIYKLFNII